MFGHTLPGMTDQVEDVRLGVQRTLFQLVCEHLHAEEITTVWQPENPAGGPWPWFYLGRAGGVVLKVQITVADGSPR